MGYRTAVAGLALAALCAAGCGPASDADDSFRESTPQTPSPLPTASADVYAAFEELSGLTIPDDATDLEIRAENNEANLPVYRARFTTGRGGAEQFCDTEGFTAYRSADEPDEQTRQEYAITAETVEGTVTCRGGHPNARGDREAVVVFPDEETAVVHVLAFAYPDS